VAVFLVGIVGAMVVTQRLRSEGPVVSQIRMKYKPSAPERVCFRAARDDVYEVSMVDLSGRVVRVLASGAKLEGDPSAGRDSDHCFNWDGLDQAGLPAPAGIYRLRVSLADADRTAISGEKLRVPEAAAPVAASDQAGAQ
jgi:hypothetical protein